jgi:glutathione S-transferase
MLILYVRTGCPFSAKVLATIETLKVPVTIRNIADEGAMDELLERGGKDQLPFLYSEDGEVNIYESDTINRYLATNFGTTPAVI